MERHVPQSAWIFVLVLNFAHFSLVIFSILVGHSKFMLFSVVFHPWDICLISIEEMTLIGFLLRIKFSDGLALKW
jgi:hypothetical protein